MPPLWFLLELEKLRVNTGVIRITSGFRCWRHNFDIGGAPSSFHTMSYNKFADFGAADIQCIELMHAWQMNWIELVLGLLEATSIAGIIAHRANEHLWASYIHVDGREDPYFKIEED